MTRPTPANAPLIPVTLCGGAGTRLWPLSRESQPKQFIPLIGERTLFQASLLRAAGLANGQKPIVVTAEELGVTLRYQGKGDDEVAIVDSIEGDKTPALRVSQIVVRIDPRYFRPTVVETLLGDPTKAKEKLGWVPEISVQEMCAEMVANDLEEAKRNALLKQHGYSVSVSIE